MSAVISEVTNTRAKSKRTLNPIKGITHWFNNVTSDSSFQDHFIIRNDVKVIKPFLDGINAEYKLIHQLLFVRNTPEVIKRLEELDFKLANDVFHGMKWNGLPTSKHLKDTTIRLYHREYNIEIYLQPAESWSIVTSACIITDDLAKKDKIKVPDTFLSVYDSLLTIMIGGTKK
ncbi:MAG: hypothetical protein EO766_11835 [Hydrotalea sp. AMD]|uniref:hypothetical protein n=1 Tax=Hydrotalea sp. AMD TaxID=2501297 RepID=UPI0010260D92|nr:hypothetical protein [Hydrotalea sp. AMD]RWZ87214.1 MAG: hypothetical protein EO766_11835 [Hydrotalea sp. AMD]